MELEAGLHGKICAQTTVTDWVCTKNEEDRVGNSEISGKLEDSYKCTA